MCVLNSYSHAEITEFSYSHSPLIILISHRHPRRLDNQPPQVCFNIARIALIRGLGSCLIGNSGYVIIKFICTSGFGFQVYSSTSFLPHIQSIYFSRPHSPTGVYLVALLFCYPDNRKISDEGERTEQVAASQHIFRINYRCIRGIRSGMGLVGWI